MAGQSREVNFAADLSLNFVLRLEEDEVGFDRTDADHQARFEAAIREAIAEYVISDDDGEEAWVREYGLDLAVHAVTIPNL